MGITKNDLKYYSVEIDNIGKVHLKYSSMAVFKKEEVKSPIRDFLLKQIEHNNFGSSTYEAQEILQDIFTDKVMKSEELLIELLGIIEEENKNV